MTDETKNALSYLKLAYKSMFNTDDSLLEDLTALWKQLDEETHVLINEVIKDWSKKAGSI